MPAAHSIVRAALILSVTLVSLLLTSRRAEASGPPRIAVFQTSTDDPALHELASALDPMLADELGRSAAVQISERPALDLPAMQLAIDCVGETADCLRSVTDQTHVEGLIAGSLRRAGGETVITLFYFDARGVGGMKGVTRKHGGTHVEQDTLDDLPAMVNELLGVANETKQPAPEAPASNATPAPAAAPADQPAASSGGVPVGPIVLGATGAVLIGVGAAFGFMEKSSQDAYASARVDPKQSVAMQKKAIDAIDNKLSSAKSQALLFNLSLGLGAAAIAGSVIWWVLSPNKNASHEHASLAPLLGPGQLGLMVYGRFAGNL